MLGSCLLPRLPPPEVPRPRAVLVVDPRKPELLPRRHRAKRVAKHPA